MEGAKACYALQQRHGGLENYRIDAIFWNAHVPQQWRTVSGPPKLCCLLVV